MQAAIRRITSVCKMDSFDDPNIHDLVELRLMDAYNICSGRQDETLVISNENFTKLATKKATKKTKKHVTFLLDEDSGNDSVSSISEMLSNTCASPSDNDKLDDLENTTHESSDEYDLSVEDAEKLHRQNVESSSGGSNTYLMNRFTGKFVLSPIQEEREMTLMEEKYILPPGDETSLDATHSVSPTSEDSGMDDGYNFTAFPEDEEEGCVF